MRYELRLATSPRHRIRQAAMVGLALGTLIAFGIDTWQGPLPQPRFWMIFLTSGGIIAMLFHRFLALRGGFMPVLLDLGHASLRMTTGRGQALWEIPFHSLELGRPKDAARDNLLISGPGIRFLLNAHHLVALDGRDIDDPIDALTLLEHQLLTRSRAAPANVRPVPLSVEPSSDKPFVDAETPAADAPSPDAATARPMISPAAMAASAPLGPATLSISVLLGLVFAAQWRLGAVYEPGVLDPLPLLSLGANSSPLVQQGEWQRLITGNFLHGDLKHLLFNGFALISFGRFIEGRLGTARFLVIFLAACLGGAIASALLNNVLISVGASTGILGLVGAYGMIDWYFTDDRRRALRRQGILLFLALGLPALLVPNADHFGHAGGLVVGLLVAWWMLSPWDAVTPELLTAAQRSPQLRETLQRWFPDGRLPDAEQKERHRRRLRWATVMATALSVLFLSVAAWTVWQRASGDLRSGALALLQVTELPNQLVNNTAWTLAIDPNASTPELQAARQAMAWAEQPDSEPMAAEIDTLATLHFRLGNVQRAIALQRWALALDPRPELASQLSRFLHWQRQHDGPLLEGFSSVPEVTVLHRSAEDCVSSDAFGSDMTATERTTTDVEIRYPPPTATGEDTEARHIHILMERRGVPVALLQVDVPDHSTAGSMVCSELPDAILGCDLEAHVGLATTSSPIPWSSATTSTESSTADSAPCRLLQLDPATLELPGPKG